MRRILPGKKSKHGHPKVIAVVGSVKGAGCTQFSIALAETIRILYGKRTAVIELNGSNDFEKIEKQYARRSINKKNNETEMYDIHNVSYYKRVSQKKFFEIYAGTYQYIVLDIGTNFQKQKEMIIISDKKCLITCHSPWKYEENLKSIEWLDENLQKERFECFSSFGVPCNKKIFRQVPIYATPFELEKKLLSFFVDVLED